MSITLSSSFRERMQQLTQKRESFLFIIDFLGENAQIHTPKEANSLGILYKLPHTNSNLKQIPYTHSDIHFQKYPPSYRHYSQAFTQVKAALQAGDSYLVNLSLPTRVETNLTLEQIFWQSNAPYKLLLPNQFTCFSPESFVKIRQNIISSYPMKGTIDANIPNARQILLEDTKELAEHATIVDLIRNDLSQIAKKVRLKNFRYLDYIATNGKALYQVSSEITGHLPAKWHHTLDSLLEKLLPAGSISGAPKRKTLEIIQTVENYNRGFYTGIFGYFDGYNLDSAVMIRFLEQNQGGKLYFKSGGGITAFSQLEQEYQELVDKVYLPITRKTPSITLLQN